MGLDSVELVMGIEAAFGIRIADEDARKLVTPRAIIDWLMRKQSAGELFAEPAHLENRVRSQNEIAIEVRQIITAQTGIRKFSDDDRFIEDLRIDDRIF